jgi:hypothetical protein
LLQLANLFEQFSSLLVFVFEMMMIYDFYQLISVFEAKTSTNF